jgi:nitrite reductase/ring-hydroxylating ferredoxin subunit
MLLEVPVIGRHYMVPTVDWHVGRRWSDWPVSLPAHRDIELQVPALHYHIDVRFLTPEQEGMWKSSMSSSFTVMANAKRENGVWVDDTDTLYSMPEPVWKLRECIKGRGAAVKMPPVISGYVGKQCKHDGHGWVCPHRGYRLASEPIVDGAINCPLHGLYIDNETGIVIRDASKR